MIQVTAAAATNADLEKEVDADLDAYNKWCQERLGETLAKSERAILKTYLWFKVKESGESSHETPKVEAGNGA